MATVTWNGRIRINEPVITPEEYKMFFDRIEYGISFETANLILKANANGDMDEVVPADELDYEFRVQIADKIMAGEKEGTLESNGQTLNWTWDLLSVKDDDGNPTSFDELGFWVKKRIIHDSLENECVWGIVDC